MSTAVPITNFCWWPITDNVHIFTEPAFQGCFMSLITFNRCKLMELLLHVNFFCLFSDLLYFITIAHGQNKMWTFNDWYTPEVVCLCGMWRMGINLLNDNCPCAFSTSKDFYVAFNWITVKSPNIRRTLVGNDKIVDHSDAVGASPVGAAPTTSSLST